MNYVYEFRVFGNCLTDMIEEIRSRGYNIVSVISDEKEGTSEIEFMYYFFYSCDTEAEARDMIGFFDEDGMIDAVNDMEDIVVDDWHFIRLYVEETNETITTEKN